MNGKQMLGLLVLVGGIVGAVALLSGDDRPQTGRNSGVLPVAPGNGTAGVGDTAARGEREPFVSADQCKQCHADVYAEWTESYHGQAWTDPMVQALSNGFRMTECVDCHAPQPIHVTGVDKRVAPRAHARADGVDCLSCHILEDGISVAAARTVDTSATAGACRPVEVPSMRDSGSCIGCHNQHETVNEVAESGTGHSCQDCHMTAVDREVANLLRRRGIPIILVANRE